MNRSETEIITTEQTPASAAREANQFVTEVRRRVAEVVVGQDTVVERILIALFTGGHLMLQGVPGLAKTLLVNAVARAIDLDFSRIQFTIDMLPSDVVGSEVLDQKTGQFRVHKGPVFTNLLLADEINRAAPKAQSAMLEAMQERKVTIGNETFKLPVPFLVIATQNPVESSGTFELPEAQLDRFMLYHRLDYPAPHEEEDIIRRQLRMGLKKDESGGAVPNTAFDMIAAEPCATIPDLVRAMEVVQKVHVSDVFLRHCVELVNCTRRSEHLDFGASPRAGLALVAAAQARAFIYGRDYVVPEDVFELVEDVILHRIRLTYEATAEGYTGRDVLESILSDLS
jgi:MoxR-like ATPase